MINLPQNNIDDFWKDDFLNRNLNYDNQKNKTDIQIYLKNFYKKCVYCETTGNLEIEHYRPKGAVKEFDGTKTFDILDSNNKIHTGYFWLKNELSNMLWVCRDCNAGVGGKHTKFPIKGTRIFEAQTDKTEFRVNSNSFLNEKALLLHPLLDKPEEHLKVDFNGKLLSINNSEKGEMTINICNLNRFSLKNEERKTIIDNFFKQIQELLNYILDFLDTDIFKVLENSKIEKLVLIFETFFNILKINSAWDKKFSRVYYFMLIDFDNFIQNSEINKNLIKEEKEFLTKIFNYYLKKRILNF